LGTNISNEQADYLLKLPKKIVDKDQILDQILIDQEFGFNKRFEMISEVDSEFTFLFEIQQSKKNRLRLSFHHQDNESKIGLLRVDYNGGHKNPEKATDNLPEKFKPYVGKFFDNNEHHIHYYVEGYRSLAWAIPLTDDNFIIKEINEGSDFNDTFVEIIKLFASVINVKTRIEINTLLL